VFRSVTTRDKLNERVDFGRVQLLLITVIDIMTLNYIKHIKFNDVTPPSLQRVTFLNLYVIKAKIYVGPVYNTEELTDFSAARK
jgi:hypothetical protein